MDRGRENGKEGGREKGRKTQKGGNSLPLVLNVILSGLFTVDAVCTYGLSEWDLHGYLNEAFEGHKQHQVQGAKELVIMCSDC